LVGRKKLTPGKKERAVGFGVRSKKKTKNKNKNGDC